MEFSKKTNSFIALLLLAATFNTHKTHTMELIKPKNIGWVVLAGATIFGGYEALKQFLSYIHEEPIDPFPFTALPKDVQNIIISLLTNNISAKNLEEAAYTINSLAQVNKELNALINEPNFCLQIIKHLSKQFNCSDEEAAQALQTQEAKKRLFIQKQFLFLCQNKDFDEQDFNNLLYKSYKDYVDLNFTYIIEIIQNQKLHKIRSNLLFALINRVIRHDKNNCPFIQTLLNDGANINATGTREGHTALMQATINNDIDIVKCLLNNPNIAINQQDNNGNTALFFSYVHPAHRRLIVMKLLLDAGADPEITNNNGITPLQKAQQTGDQEIIDLIQDAIRKKHERQGK